MLNGVVMKIMVQVGGIKVEIDDLKTLVGEHGGFQNVNDGKLWPKVARGMGIDSSKCANAASSLKRIFQQRVLAEPVATSEQVPMASSILDRSVLAAKLLAKRKAAEAFTSVSVADICHLKSEINEEKHDASRSQFSLGGSVDFKLSSEACSQLSMQRLSASHQTKCDVESDDCNSAKLEDEMKPECASKVKKEKDDLKVRPKSCSESNMKSETDSTRGLFSTKEELRRDSNSSRNVKDGEPARRRSRRDADSLGQSDDIPEKKLSRDERKFRSILRQIELLEKKQRGPDATPATTPGDASPRRNGVWDNEADLASLTRRRKDLLKEELREKERERERLQDRERREKEKEREREKERKEKEQDSVSGKKRPASQPKDVHNQQLIDLNINANKKPKGPSKQTPSKTVVKVPGRKSSKLCDDRLQGPLAILREYKKAARKVFPCFPRVSSKNCGLSEDKSSMCSKKAHIFSSLASESNNRQSEEQGTGHGALWESEIAPERDPFRLNPHRRPEQKKIFPIVKRLLSQWMHESADSAPKDSRVCTIPEEPVGRNRSKIDDSARREDFNDVDKSSAKDPDCAGSFSSANVCGTGLSTEEHSRMSGWKSECDEVASEMVTKSLSSTSVGDELHSGLAEQSQICTRDTSHTSDHGHRATADTANLPAQNRHSDCKDLISLSPNHQLGGTDKSGHTECRGSPPLSPVSSDGVPSRNCSPGEPGSLDSCPRSADASGGHRKPSAQDKLQSSPRNRHTTAWDLTPIGDRSVHESRDFRDGKEGRDSRERRERDRDREREGRNSNREGTLSNASARDTSLHRDRQRDISPLTTPLRRRQSPPRPLFTGEIRERGMQSTEGGLSRESLRRERQVLAISASCRTRERQTVSSSTAVGRDRERFVSLNGVGEHLGRQTERPGKQWAADLVRTHSPCRSLDRGERGLVVSERMGLERGGQDRAVLGGGNGAARERSLSPRSKEALREMQVARERRAKGARIFDFVFNFGCIYPCASAAFVCNAIPLICF